MDFKFYLEEDEAGFIKLILVCVCGLQRDARREVEELREISTVGTNSTEPLSSYSWIWTMNVNEVRSLT